MISDFCIHACAARQCNLHRAAALKDVALTVDNGVDGGNKSGFNRFLVPVRRFAFVLTLKFSVALPDDPF